MTKLFKGVLATMLSVGFLAGCGPKADVHTVTFWEDNVGKHYADVKVEHGKKVEMPADPERTGYDFEGWFENKTFTTEFSPEKLIEDDLDVYGKWKKQYVPDTRTFHIVGGLANTDLSYVNWNATGVEGTDWDTRSYLTIAEDRNLYTIEVEIGYMGKFKIKQPGQPWDGGQEYDYTDIPENLRHEYLQEGDTRNVQVKTAGKYRIEIETDLNEIYVTRTGDATGAGVTQDPDPNAIVPWGMIGSITDWGNSGIADIQPIYEADPGYHLFRSYYFEVGDQFKFRANSEWTIQIGYKDGMTLPEGITTEMENDLPKNGGNFIVTEAGFYTAVIKKVGEENVLTLAKTVFALRGDAVGGWDNDTEQKLALVDTTTVDDVTTYTYEADYTLAVGEFKVKLGAVGDYAGWDTSFGEGSANFKCNEAGEYTVTLTVTFDAATLSFDGTASFAPKAVA